MRKCDMYLADRSNGMTYREIADKYGISYQAVHTSCLQAGGPSSLMLSSKACVYPRLRRGTTESCGCGKGLKHGHHKKPWYSSYKAMMERCYLPSSGNYKRYGGKGVTVCEEWHDINKFAEWAETSGYAPGLTIDRIDPAGNYEPSNCQWLTRSENSKKSHADKKKKAKEMVEVVHGRWEDVFQGNCAWARYKCSVCGGYALYRHEQVLDEWKTVQVLANYCPCCGAYMGNGEENGEM